ncbi:MAG: hypothetical protein M1358_00850 [Chloroflexi bacterium]|nr:hypothetical protein [Chloroflexota bacterium]
MSRENEPPAACRLSPEELSLRSLTGRIGARVLHSRYDSKQLTENARKSFLAKFELEVDPKQELDPEERKRRAEQLRKAHFARLALASSKARKQKAKKGQIRQEVRRDG